MSIKDAVKGLTESKEQEQDTKVITDEAKRLIEKKEELAEINSRKASMEEALQKCKEEQLKSDLPRVMREQNKQKIKNISTELADLKEKQDYLQKVINGLTYIVENKKNFDKTRVFSNIREIMKVKDVKLGQLETDGGSQPGYMSRLEKEGNTSDPTIEFVVTAAKILDVPLDTLINGSIGEITPTEKYLLRFIRSLIDDTRADKICWKRQNKAVFDKVRILNYETGEMSHPLYDCEINPYDGPDKIFYNSKFYPEEEVSLDGNSYVADLPDTNSKIYLMSCMRDWDFFYEIYLVDNNVNPVCCSTQSCGEVATMMDTLYKEAELASNHVHLDNNTKSIISSYLDKEDVPF